VKRALLLVAALLLAGCGGSDETARTPPATTAVSGGQSSRTCEAGQTKTKPNGTLKASKEELDPGKNYSLVFETNCGSFTVQLDQKLAPKTAASLVFLANRDFFDGTAFHRIVPGFVIQGGDPTSSGLGGPGYQTVDPPPRNAKYTHGVVAMAKAGDEPAGTSGSQFFVVTAEDAGLPPDYAIVGKVMDGLDVVDKIGTLGDGSEQPTEPVVIRDVLVKAS